MKMVQRSYHKRTWRCSLLLFSHSSSFTLKNPWSQQATFPVTSGLSRNLLCFSQLPPSLTLFCPYNHISGKKATCSTTTLQPLSANQSCFLLFLFSPGYALLDQPPKSNLTFCIISPLSYAHPNRLQNLLYTCQPLVCSLIPPSDAIATRRESTRGCSQPRHLAKRATKYA